MGMVKSRLKVIIWKGYWSFCLGNILVLQKDYDVTTYNHEYGHHLQYLKYGFFLYYTKIAVPSVIGWWIDILFHRDWTLEERLKWYYNQPWEKEADKLGRVKRDYL